MKIAKELAKEAKRKGICEPWYKELKTLEDKRAMVHINRYEGGKVTTDTIGEAVIKIVEKHKKTY